ncbi:MAG: glycosyl transferase, partial [Hydrogenimonas sp.]|nr:glycosyl transferase [Hydrogenimonas sp.]
IVVSGGALQPAKGGATVKDVIEAIKPPKNLHYFDRRDYNPDLAALTPTRKALGIRTGLNTIERLPGIGGCDTALIGVFHKPYVKKYIDIFGDRYKRLVIVKGNEGTPEVFGKCRIWIHENFNTKELSIDPADFGIEYRKSFKRISKTESLKALKSPSSKLMDIAKLNAAIWLYAKNMASSIKEAFEKIDG